jgi:prepilin signal peptidase PulO-like enzyme (type II secretory pathway)
MNIDLSILFLFGLAFGSFFNVVILRYDGERWLGDPRTLGGRSHCPHCRATLQWFELVPLLSFLGLRGRCRHCGARIGWHYFAVELLAGFIFAAVPWRLAVLGAPALAVSSVLWIAVFSLLLIMSAIDLRLGLIPDELSAILLLIGLGLAALWATGGIGSLLGPFAGFLGLPSPLWLNRIAGAGFAVLIFGGLWLLTRGRGMGMGDVKLALPLGVLFGWPDSVAVAVGAFVIGAVVGVAAILFKGKTMKSAIPFGPFLAISAIIVFFFGAAIVTWYFRALGLGV